MSNPYDRNHTSEEVVAYVVEQAQATSDAAGAMNQLVARAMTAAQAGRGAYAVHLTGAALLAAEALGVDRGESLSELEAKYALALGDAGR